MKKILFGVVLGVFQLTNAQENAPSPVRVYGGFESNGQWYTNDKGLRINSPEDPLRSNNYLFVNTGYKNWTAGVQVEAYEDQALLNYNPKYKNTNLATYFVQFKGKKVDVTGGYFYDQFGSGLLYRSWEDRALGINNALCGARIIYKPTDFISFKSIAGRQRTGFGLSKGFIAGGDLDFKLTDFFSFKTSDLSVGLTFVLRNEPIENIVDPVFSPLVHASGVRVNFSHNSFYSSAEFNLKSDDAVVQVNQLRPKFVKPGSALLVNLGYSKKGFGIDGSFRRMENMGFFSERLANGNIFNDRIVNFIPSLTKQHHSNLANIYPYQAQPNVFINFENGKGIGKAGEIGGQIDLFYNFKKGTALGGKYGTKLAVNFSNWNALSGNFYAPLFDYETDFFAFGKRYFSDINVDFIKKWSPTWQSELTWIHQYYDKNLIVNINSGTEIIQTQIVAAESTHRFGKDQSVRWVAEHMWANADKKNWASATLEYNLNSKWSLYTTDLYNYGNSDRLQRNHYYNAGAAFRHKTTRIAMSYGRQRGGLICVGGVCREVPESSGVSLSLNTSF